MKQTHDRPSHDAWLDGARAALALTAAYLVWAALLLSNFGLEPFAPEKLGLVFNDMARRLLSFDFSISPAAIQFEAFVVRGVTTTYYGIFPALLRLPLIALGRDGLDVSRVSCLVALGVTVFAYVRLMQAALDSLGSRLVRGAILLGLVISGPQIFLLASASLYHELIFWSSALTAVFNLILLRRWLRNQEPTTADLYAMALLAGCCLLCRITAGVGLYAALLFLLCRAFLLEVRAIPPGMRLLRLVAGPGWLWSLIGAGCVALLFVGVQGLVNAERWGNALTASPYEYYVQFARDSDALARFARHGLFSWTRVGMAILYYGTGIKLEQVFPAAFEDFYGGIEGPRAVVPLLAPLVFGLALAGLATLLRRVRRGAAPALAGLGQVAGLLLVLGYQALCLRYAMDGWGLLMLVAAVGARRVAGWGRVAGLSMMLLMLGGAAGSHLMLLRYKIVYSGTDAQTRYDLSARLQPLLCPRATLDRSVKLTDFNPLVTPNCPPLW